MENTSPIIREAEGFAHKPGRTTYRRDIQRLLSRAFVWVLFRKQVPLAIRQFALFRVLAFAQWFSQNPIWSPVFGASKGDTFENDLQKLTFNATAIANFADNAASSPITVIEVSLHTADPGETGNQTTSECAYTGYSRVAVTRTSSGWTVSSNSVSPVANIDFPACTGGSETVTHFAVGTAHTSTGKILYSGTVSPNISVSSGVTPRLTTASTITED